MREVATEAIMEALKSRDELPPRLWALKDLPSWLTNGHFAVRVSDPSKFPVKAREQSKDYKAWLADLWEYAVKASIVTEKPERYRPSVEEQEEKREGDQKCSVCDGKANHRCFCGYLHDCEVCDGLGIIEGKVVQEAIESSYGCFCVTDGKNNMALQGRFRALFDGLVMRAVCDSNSPLCGVDPDTGDLIVSAMPIAKGTFEVREDVRQTG